MSDLQQLTEQLAKEHRVPSLVTAVVRGDEVTVGTVGADADTAFFIGSTTKTLTATALMTHVEAGRVSLDDLLRDVLPEVRLHDPGALDVVTVGTLLDHTAGWRGDTLVNTGWGDDALQRAVAELLPKEPQVLRPGTVASYNNSAVLTAGRVLEVVSGREYTAAVAESVLLPLGMATTGYLPWQAHGLEVAVGHLVEDGGPRPIQGWPTSRNGGPAGGAVSSIADQVRWAQFCLYGGPVLRDETRLLMQEPRVAARSVMTGVGVSWLLQERNGTRLVTHGGNLNNLHVSAFVLAPDDGVAVIAMGNSRGAGDAGRALVDHVLGVPEPLPVVAAPDDLVGVYEGGAWQQHLTAADGKLFTQMVLPEGTSDDFRALFHRPPTEIVAVGPDQLALAARPGETVGDVGRDENGDVAWLRWGMRVMPRSES